MGMSWWWRLLISLAPVVLALVGKLFINLAKAKELVRDPTFYNISIELLLAAFGILLGALIVAYKDRSSDKIRREVFTCSLVLSGALLGSLALSVIVPTVMGASMDMAEVILAVILPDAIALVVFGFAVSVGT